MVTSCALVLAIGCSSSPSTPGKSDPLPNFQLICDAANTATSAELQCVRADTRTGDVVRINYLQLPTTNGPTATTAGPAGTYTTACSATSMTTRADFYCLRMNTVTGELMLLNLQKVAVYPDATKH